jgi:hypothetical protein
LMFKFDFTPKLYDSLERIVSEILNMWQIVIRQNQNTRL